MVVYGKCKRCNIKYKLFGIDEHLHGDEVEFCSNECQKKYEVLAEELAYLTGDQDNE